MRLVLTLVLGTLALWCASTFLPALGIQVWVPNVAVLVVMLATLRGGAWEGLVVALVLGLMEAWLSGASRGVILLSLLPAITIAFRLLSTPAASSLMVCVGGVALGVLLADLVVAALLLLLGSPVSWLNLLLRTLPPSALLTAFLAWPAFGFVRWLEPRVQEREAKALL